MVKSHVLIKDSLQNAYKQTLLLLVIDWSIAVGTETGVVNAKEKQNTINVPRTHNQRISYSGKVLAIKCNRADLLANSTNIIK